MRLKRTENIVALAGGVGGAKLAEGLARAVSDRLMVVVNTGDDFVHLGFSISPDLDTVTYTLAGLVNAEAGWGVANDSWSFMDQIDRLGGPTWFRLGDRDLALHALRTERLRAGVPLSTLTRDLAHRLGVTAHVVPMSDEPVRTLVRSGDETLPFQDYFVRLRAEPAVTALSFEGAEDARPAPEFAAVMASEIPAAVIVCPSNPYLSIDPILSVPGMREWVESVAAPVVAVSPIVGGAAVKGPAAKIMRELGHAASALTVARHYGPLLSGLIIDEQDADLAAMIESEGTRVRVTSTVMRSSGDRVGLAQECLTFADELGGSQRG